MTRLERVRLIRAKLAEYLKRKSGMSYVRLVELDELLELLEKDLKLEQQFKQ